MSRLTRNHKGLPKLTVTSISTISDIIVNVPIAREMFSEIVRLLRLYLTIPATTATAERSFSSLRRIKTYLRSTMTEQRLNNILLLHAHKEMMDALNLTEIARLCPAMHEGLNFLVTLCDFVCTFCINLAILT